MISSKDRILDAAERVVLRDGGGHLTLDAVAHEAALSKGGVLYNFPTKEDLIRGMIARLSQRFGAEMARLAASDPSTGGRNTRAYVDACFPAPTALSAPHDRVAAGLLAAVATNPSLLDSLQEAARFNSGRADRRRHRSGAGYNRPAGYGWAVDGRSIRSELAGPGLAYSSN